MSDAAPRPPQWPPNRARISRRRFLTVAAALLTASPARAQACHTWQGRAMGADARITLCATDAATAHGTFRRVEQLVARLERQFSLYVDSELTRLNHVGRLAHPSAQMLALMTLAGKVHEATGGAFDPSVQPLWLALSRGAGPSEVAAARALIGWRNVSADETRIRLARRGMALTFNGIAQGWIADRVADLLRSAGFGDVLVDMGEVQALGERPGGGPWQAGVALPDGREVARLALSDTAVATSSPGGLMLDPQADTGHILDPHGGRARWRLASVTAPSAAVADALSTAFCVMDRPAIDAALSAFADARLAALVPLGSGPH